MIAVKYNLLSIANNRWGFWSIENKQSTALSRNPVSLIPHMHISSITIPLDPSSYFFLTVYTIFISLVMWLPLAAFFYKSRRKCIDMLGSQVVGQMTLGMSQHERSAPSGGLRDLIQDRMSIVARSAFYLAFHSCSVNLFGFNTSWITIQHSKYKRGKSEIITCKVYSM